MFDLVHKHKRIAQFILFLIMIPFAFFGVDYYFRGERRRRRGRDVRRRQDHARRNSRRRSAISRSRCARRCAQGVDPAMFDNPEVRFALLEHARDERLRREEGQRPAFPRVERSRCFDAHRRAIPRFQDDGKFSLDRYKHLLRRQGITEPAFEDSMRQRHAAGASRADRARRRRRAASAGEFVNLVEQQREVAFAKIDVEPFVKDVKVDEAQEKAFYDAQRGGVPDARGSEVRVRRADAGCAARRRSP